MNDYLEIRELYHHGIKGQRWGIRRYQNPDGTLNDAGKIRYNQDGTKKKLSKMSDSELNRANQRLAAERNYNSLTGKNYKNRSSNTDILIKAGASAAGSAIITMGAYLLKEKAKSPDVALGQKSFQTASMLALLATTVGFVSSVTTSLGGQATIQNIGSQKKKKN